MAGLLAERGTLRSLPGILLTLILGNIVLYVPGVIWLAAYTGLGKAVSFGFVPFLVGDALKTIVGVGLLSGANAVRQGMRRAVLTCLPLNANEQRPNGVEKRSASSSGAVRFAPI